MCSYVHACMCATVCASLVRLFAVEVAYPARIQANTYCAGIWGYCVDECTYVSMCMCVCLHVRWCVCVYVRAHGSGHSFMCVMCVCGVCVVCLHAYIGVCVLLCAYTIVLGVCAIVCMYACVNCEVV